MCSHERIKEQLENPKYYQIHQFSYDYVCDERSSQDEVYEVAAKEAIEYCFKGFNSSILAYGQTGTGKTYTMEGFSETFQDGKMGIFPRAVLDIFDQIENNNIIGVKSIKISYLQIYNENLSDLLKPDRSNLSIREDKKRGIFVDGQSEWQVKGAEEVFEMIERGGMSRPTASTKMNELSSRSHAMFIITIERQFEEDGYKRTQVGKLNFVDLAGSERLRVTGATGKRLEECKKINRSLAALGNVISALSSKKERCHIPYRNSKLTRLLEDSLGGNCKTIMMAMISPAIESFNESISTLKFASRAKNIKCTPTLNGEIEVDPKIQLKKYEEELKNLRMRNEEKIVAEIESEEPLIVREENRESEQVQRQLEKYKQLLLKQRDIMIALTSRLNNRDETILQLRSELELSYAHNMANSNMTNNGDMMMNNGMDCSGSDQYYEHHPVLGRSVSMPDKENYNKKIGNLRDQSTNECLNPRNDVDNYDHCNIDHKRNIDETVKALKKADKLSGSQSDGLDEVIDALTKQNDSINLHKIAQSILELQKKSHKLKKVVGEKCIENLNPLLKENPLANNNNSSQQYQKKDMANTCSFGNINTFNTFVDENDNNTATIENRYADQDTSRFREDENSQLSNNDADGYANRNTNTNTNKTDLESNDKSADYDNNSHPRNNYFLREKRSFR